MGFEFEFIFAVFFLLVFVEELLHDNLSVLEFPLILLVFLGELKVLAFEVLVGVIKLFGLAFEVVQLIVERPDLLLFVLLHNHSVELRHYFLCLFTHLLDLFLHYIHHFVLITFNSLPNVFVHHVDYVVYSLKVIVNRLLRFTH